MAKRMKIVSGIVLALAVFIIAAVIFWWSQRIPSVSKEFPPSSAEIYHTLDRLWRKGDFNVLDTYVIKLRKEWGHYLPAQLALAKYYYKVEVDVDKAIETLNVVNASLTNHMIHVSPLFKGELESLIRRYVETSSFRQGYGDTKEICFKRLNPRTMDPKKRGKSWMDETLFFNTPELLLTSEGIRSVNPAPDSEPSLSGIKVLQEDQLMTLIGGSYTPILDRKAAVHELVSRRLASGKTDDLLKGLYEHRSLYTYHATADQVVKKGAEAVPALLACLDTHKIFTDRRMIIWPLIRIGDARPEVIQALEKVRDENPPSLRDSPYGKQAIEYLKRNHEKAP